MCCACVPACVHLCVTVAIVAAFIHVPVRYFFWLLFHMMNVCFRRKYFRHENFASHQKNKIANTLCKYPKKNYYTFLCVTGEKNETHKWISSNNRTDKILNAVAHRLQMGQNCFSNVTRFWKNFYLFCRNFGNLTVYFYV